MKTAAEKKLETKETLAEKTVAAAPLPPPQPDEKSGPAEEEDKERLNKSKANFKVEQYNASPKLALASMTYVFVDFVAPFYYKKNP